jgi:hypothetical protein
LKAIEAKGNTNAGKDQVKVEEEEERKKVYRLASREKKGAVKDDEENVDREIKLSLIKTDTGSVL